MIAPLPPAASRNAQLCWGDTNSSDNKIGVSRLERNVVQTRIAKPAMYPPPNIKNMNTSSMVKAEALLV